MKASLAVAAARNANPEGSTSSDDTGSIFTRR
jgi:hypothetical protein